MEFKERLAKALIFDWIYQFKYKGSITEIYNKIAQGQTGKAELGEIIKELKNKEPDGGL